MVGRRAWQPTLIPNWLGSRLVVPAWAVEPISQVDPLRAPPPVTTQGLGLFYGRQPAFRTISVTFQPGRVTAIIGPSGCGKTSFLNCINRLYELDKNTQLVGKLWLGDQEIHSIPLWKLRREVGMVFQRPTPFPLSIEANLAFPLGEHGVRDRSTRARMIKQVLQEVGLWEEVKDRLRSPALSLSGGQQQRLCLARALVLKPRVLLMDEPCSALDPMSSEVIEGLIQRLRGEYTLVIVTHNLAQASRVADDVAVFWNQDGMGELIEYGAVEQIFNAPQHPLTQAYVSGKRG
jgi:phosphate transport system ATP-binding protein